MGAVTGVGLDVVDLDRARRFAERYDDATLGLVFTPGELARARRLRHPELALGVCLAAKEAAGKALGCGLAGLAWTDVDIAVDGGGLRVSLRGAAAELAAACGVRRWLGSWSVAAGRVHVCLLAEGAGLAPPGELARPAGQPAGAGA